MDLDNVLSKVSVIYSKRKTICIQIDKELNITVRAPLRTSKKQILEFLSKNLEWINVHYERMELKKKREEQEGTHGYTPEEIEKMTKAAKEVIPARVAYFAPLVGVDYGRITIRNQRSRWGSCSGKGNLNFNCMLMKVPPMVLDYVVVHELCHRLEMNHSKAFWMQVERVMPGYKMCKKWLKEYGDVVMKNPI